MTIGEKIVHLRIVNNISQEELPEDKGFFDDADMDDDDYNL